MGLQKLIGFARRLEHKLLVALQNHISGGPPALSYAVQEQNPQLNDTKLSDIQSTLDSLFKDSFLWAVPKKRVSWERRNLKRHGFDKMNRWVKSKENIIACLVCGHWHLRHTICGNCYEKVKKETELMKANMGDEEFYYNAPKSEVVYIYEDEKEQKDMYKGKYIVETKRDKPTWWSSNLLTKAFPRR